MAKKKAEVKNETEVKIVSAEEEQAKLNESLEAYPLEKPIYDPSFDQQVEEKRGNIFKTYKKSRLINNIIMFGIVAVFVVSIIFMTQFSWGTLVGGIMIGVTIAGLIVYYILTRNLFPNTTKEYIEAFTHISDNYVFDNEGFSDCTLYFKKRYALADSLPDRVYKGVVDLASRNIVSGKFNKVEFTCGELALYEAGTKKYQKKVLFVGKYITLENKLHFQDRYIINIQGEKDTDRPTDVEDLVKLVEVNRFVIWGKEGSKPEEDLGKDFIESLKSIDCVNSLLNVNIALWAGHTAAYLSYDDHIAAIPFDKAINADSYIQLKKNIKDVLSILTTI